MTSFGGGWGVGGGGGGGGDYSSQICDKKISKTINQIDDYLIFLRAG